ncbi:LPXTG cell wall anchor domain-containing protein [Streptomyces sp. NPDC046631]|uniref:LPXTG cell wall anchor domain-containing protein n=1 Tax=unclassified Streptomyces TaxID=2593676 RepID=UPI0033ED2742
MHVTGRTAGRTGSALAVLFSTPTGAEKSSQPVPAPSAPSSEPKDDGGFLASTGAQVGMYATAAGVLGGLGAGLLMFTRRRRGQIRG